MEYLESLLIFKESLDGKQNSLEMVFRRKYMPFRVNNQDGWSDNRNKR